MAWQRSVIILAAIGRCGSTITLETLRPIYGGAYLHSARSRKLTARCRPGQLYRTFGLPPSRFPRPTRCVWLFGDPLATMVSIDNHLDWPDNWGKTTIDHLHCTTQNPRERWLTEDVWQLERKFDAWYRQHEFPLLTVRYESLPRTFDQVADYLAVKGQVQLPEWKERETKWREHPDGATLEARFADLKSKYDNAEDVKLWEPKPRRGRSRKR